MKQNFRHPLYLFVAAGAALLMMGGSGHPANGQTTQSQATGTVSSAGTATVRSSVTGTAKSGMTGTVSGAGTAAIRSNGTGTVKSSMTGSAARGATVTRITLSPYAEELARILKFDRQVMIMVKEETQQHIHRLIGHDENGFQIIAPGFAVPVPENTTDRVLAVLRKKLAPMHYLPFIVEMNAGLKMDKIGVIKGTDQYEILRVMQTNGDDYDISNQDIIDRLREWEKCCAFVIIGAENDWVELEFKTLPKDLNTFAEEVYEFSPDAVDQGWGSVDGLVKEIKKTNRLFLWWD